MAELRRIPFWIRVVLPVGLALLALAYGLTRWWALPGDLAAIEDRIDEAFPDVEQMSTARLADLLEHRGDPDGPRLLLVDTREPGEYAVSRIPGAVNLQTAEAVMRSLEASASRPTRIVVYCSVGIRASRLARALQQRGVHDVANLRGSIFRWANEDRPLERPDGRRTDKVHPYDAAWGRLLAPGKAAMSPDP